MISVEAFREALSTWAVAIDDRGVSKLPAFDENEQEISLDDLKPEMASLVVEGTSGDRSAAFYGLVAYLWRAGHSHHRIFDVLDQHPDGIAEKYKGRLQQEIDRICLKVDDELVRYFEPLATQPSTAQSVETASEPLFPLTNSFPLMEDEAALQFAEENRGRLRFCFSHGAWFLWTETHWQRDLTQRAFHWAREKARAMARDEHEKVRVQFGKMAFAAAVERGARADPALAVTADRWDSDPYLLGTPGGTVDLRSGKMRPADPADGMTKITAVAPAANADCPVWIRFLTEATGSDPTLFRFLQQWAGYCLTGDTTEHALVFIYGDGMNGKSLFIYVITCILGDYAVTAPMDTFVASKGDRHSTDLAMMRGARLVTASETEQGRFWAESRIKQLTGGDPVSARFMRQDFFTYRPTFKLTITGNHKPGLKAVDGAARRRFNLVPFLHRPAVPDRHLGEKLRAEWPGILRWMIDGCADWRTNGLLASATVADATNDYFDQQDVFGAWLDERCTIRVGSADLKVPSADLFASWAGFAKSCNADIGTSNEFADRLKGRGIKPVKNVRTSTGGRTRGFAGIALRTSDDSRFVLEGEAP